MERKKSRMIIILAILVFLFPFILFMVLGFPLYASFIASLSILTLVVSLLLKLSGKRTNKAKLEQIKEQKIMERAKQAQ